VSTNRRSLIAEKKWVQKKNGQKRRVCPVQQSHFGGETLKKREKSLTGKMRKGTIGFSGVPNSGGGGANRIEWKSWGGPSNSREDGKEGNGSSNWDGVPLKRQKSKKTLPGKEEGLIEYQGKLAPDKGV